MRIRLMIYAAASAVSLASANIATAMPINTALKDAAPGQIENVRWHGGWGRGGWGRGGWGWGAGGFAAGALLGSALARPYYGYGYYPYLPGLPRTGAGLLPAAGLCRSRRRRRQLLHAAFPVLRSTVRHLPRF